MLKLTFHQILLRYAIQIHSKQRIESTETKIQIEKLSKYNNALKNRGKIYFWLDKDAMDNWYEENQENTGYGAPRQYTDFSIIICHEIRQVYRLPLRQSEGFINSIFRIMGLNIKCPNYSVLSKRLLKLNIPCPRYSKKDVADNNVVAMAIDSTGLKRFGRDEWFCLMCY